MILPLGECRDVPVLKYADLHKKFHSKIADELSKHRYASVHVLAEEILKVIAGGK